MTVSLQAAVASPESHTKRGWLLAFVVSLATALAVISPFLWKGNASGHDFSFHAASWMEVAAQWRDGILLPRWADGANYGFGEPRFIFYPPLSWSLGAALSFVVPWGYVPGVFIVLMQTLAGLSAYALLRRICDNRVALFGAALYAANPYALLITYMRSDFAEQLALAFFPLLLLAAFQLLEVVPVTFRSLGRTTVFFSAVFAAIWLTNAPAGVIATYGVSLLIVYAAVKRRSRTPLWRGATGMALGFGLAGFYLVPAIYEQRWVNISQALSVGLKPVENFLYTTIADQEHNSFNRIASNTALLTIVLVAVFAALSRTLLLQRRKTSVNSVWAMLVALSIVASFLMVHPSLFLWVLLPKLRFVQFPWRWMSVLGIPLVYFFAAFLVDLRTRWRVLTAAFLAAVLFFAAAYMIRHTWWDAEDVPTLREALDHDRGYEGVDEYDPVGDDHTDLPEKAERVKLLPSRPGSGVTSDAKFQIERWSPEEKEIRVTTEQPIVVALRLLDYPAWRVKVNDKRVTAQHAGTTTQMIVPLTPGTSHISARFTRTLDRTVGGALTMISFLIAVLLVLKPRAAA
jgi:hypothetical protein